MNPARLLVVDDEAAIRTFLTRLLERAGYAVQAASDGREALVWLDAGTFDLLLTDIRMDGLDGVELLAEARARTPDLAVILLTGYATVESAVAALRRGASDYLLKPVKNEEILAAVATALEQRARTQRRERLEQIAVEVLDVMDFSQGASSADRSGDVVRCGALVLDLNAYIATLAGQRLELTPTEFRLLAELARTPGQTLGFVRLVQAACGYTCARHQAREIIGTHVLNLRARLGIRPGEPLYVESTRGVGYRLVPPLEATTGNAV